MTDASCTSNLDRHAAIDRFLALRPLLGRRLFTKSLPPDLQEALRPVTIHQIEALKHLYPSGLIMRDLAHALDITDGSAALLSDRLVKQGLAERRPDPADRRMVWLVPSEKARQLVERFREIERQVLLESLQVLDDAHLAAFLEAIELLAAANLVDEDRQE